MRNHKANATHKSSKNEVILRALQVVTNVGEASVINPLTVGVANIRVLIFY